MPRHSCIDELDLKIIDALLTNSRITFKELAKSLGVDQRMISSRMARLIDEDILRNFTVEVNWKKLGFDIQATVGLETGAGEDLIVKIREFFKDQPRIIRVQKTCGGFEYVIQAVCKDTQDLGSNIGIPLGSLTTILSTSIITDEIKSPNYKPLMEIAKELCCPNPEKSIKKSKTEVDVEDQ